MRRLSFVFLLAACDGPLADRLGEPAAAIDRDCAAGNQDFLISGTVVDLDGNPRGGVDLELTTAWGDAVERTFPMNGCRLGRATSDESGRFGPVAVSTTNPTPVFVALATGEGLAPTLADRAAGCLLGTCTDVDMPVVVVDDTVATEWREELYAGGMEYALDRGLVAYQFRDRSLQPAADVEPAWTGDNAIDTEIRGLAPGSDVRFLAADHTLAPVEQTRTTASGFALVGLSPDRRPYFGMMGVRGAEAWGRVGVIVATGWIYFETGDLR